MPIDVIDFSPKQDSSSEELGGSSPYALNVIVDTNGVVSKRPGIKAYTGVAPSTVIDSTGISGLYATNDGQLFAVNNNPNHRSIYKIGNGSASKIDTLPDEQLTGFGRPVFTETEVYLVIAGGRNIQKVKLKDLVSSRLAGDPPLATHVAANSSRLLANDDTVDKTKVRFSGIFQGTADTSGMEDWTNTGFEEDGGFFTAEARPDNVVAIAENTNEIFVWGTDNVQVFVPDSSLIYAPAATKEIGTCAPYSIIKKDQEFFWLDQYRRIVYSDGRTFQNIDKPIKNQLEALTNPSDCFGFRMILGNKECFIWTFIQDQVSYVYQVDSGWAQWNSYDSTMGNFTRLNILSHHLRRDGGVNVVGTYDGKVGFLDPNTPTDFGEMINAQVATGFIDRGTDNRKFCRSIKISGRRGSTATASLGRLEWRDDTGGWNGPLYMDFGSTGDNSIVKEFRSLGVYNRRQYRFTFSDDANLSLVRVQEDFEPLAI